MAKKIGPRKGTKSRNCWKRGGLAGHNNTSNAISKPCQREIAKGLKNSADCVKNGCPVH